MTFCQNAGNHATVAAGSTVAATEIDSNKCSERKRKGERERKRRRAKGEKKEEEKQNNWKSRHGMNGDEPGLDVDCQHR